MTIRFLRPFWLQLCVAAIAWALPLAAVSHGELITFQFSGTVTGISVQNRPELQSIDFPDVGDPFMGFYRFDSTAQDTDSSPEHGTFSTVLFERAVVASIGDFQFEGRATSIGIFQNRYEVNDWIPRIELTSHPQVAATLDTNHFALVVTKESLIPDPNVIPLIPPPLDGATQRFLIMEMDNRNNLSPIPWVRIAGTLDSLTLVPEPSNLPLLSFAVACSIKIRRRRRKQAKD